jgi:DNA-binding transcriptional ArsR family regulator
MNDDGTVLNDIRRIVEEIRALLVLTKRNDLDKIKEKLLPTGSMKAKIYELCNGSNTTSMIAQAIGKDDGYVRANLSVLRRDGLVRTVEKSGDSFHEQVF